MSRENKYEIDMCNGSIMDKLISFALPLMLSGMLQLMFNAVDIVVVGRFSGSQSLAAVGATTALIYLFTNLFIGISLGANVLAARYYAAGKHEEMSETVHTAMMFALISGIIMIFVGLFFSRLALEIMGTPSDVIDQATLYMRIYFLGMPFFMLYNYGAAILRAVGDTKRPLIFLIISGVVNACLNMLLVIVFHLDVAGVAIATVTSQFISCVLVIGCLYRTKSSYQLRFSRLKILRFCLMTSTVLLTGMAWMNWPNFIWGIKLFVMRRSAAAAGTRLALTRWLWTRPWTMLPKMPMLPCACIIFSNPGFWQKKWLMFMKASTGR